MLHAAPQPWMGPRLIGMHFLHMHHWTRAAMRCPSRGTLCLGELSCFTVYHHTRRGPGSFLTWPGEHQASRQPPSGKSGSCWLCSGHVWPSLPRLLHWLVPGNFVPDFVRWEAAAQQQSWSYWVILMIWWHKFKLMRFWTERYAGFCCWNSYILRRVRSSPNHLCLSDSKHPFVTLMFDPVSFLPKPPHGFCHPYFQLQNAGTWLRFHDG